LGAGGVEGIGGVVRSGEVQEGEGLVASVLIIFVTEIEVFF